MDTIQVNKQPNTYLFIYASFYPVKRTSGVENTPYSKIELWNSDNEFLGFENPGLDSDSLGSDLYAYQFGTIGRTYPAFIFNESGVITIKSFIKCWSANGSTVDTYIGQRYYQILEMY